jgi:hypothetical protein
LKKIKKRVKGELIANGIATVFVVTIVGAALATPIYGWGPVLVVSGGLLAGSCVVRVLCGDLGNKRR